MNKFKTIVTSALISVVGMVALPAAASAAGNATYALNVSGSTAVGGTLTVSVTESSDVAVNGVQANVAYDPALLQPIGKACGAGFEIAAPDASSHISCGTITPKTGGQTAGTISFKVLAAGNSTIGLDQSSQITAADGQGTDVWNHANVSRGVALTTPAPKPTPAPRPAAPRTTAPAQTTTPPAATPTAPATTTPADTQKVEAAKTETKAAAPAKKGINGWLAASLAVLAAAVLALGYYFFVYRRGIEAPVKGKKAVKSAAAKTTPVSAISMRVRRLIKK